MRKIHSVMLHLLELLKSELWQASTAGDIFADADWEAIFAESRRQAVTALSANALERITDNRYLPPLPLAAKWMAEAETIRQTGRQMDEKLAALLAALADEGISPIVLKGQTIAAFYPDPHARQCGDIDLFITPGQRPAMDRFLSDNNMVATAHSDGSQSFMWQGIEVELHPRIFDIHSPLSLRRLSRIIPSPTQSAAKACQQANNAGLSPESTLLLLSAHILKHSIGRGIGLRQLCDLAVATSEMHKFLAPGLARRIFHAAGLRSWTSTVYSFLTIYLGLPADRLPYPGIKISRRRADRLLRIIARSGNFNSSAAEACRTSSFHLVRSRHASTSMPVPASPPRNSGQLRFISTALFFIRRSSFSMLTAPAEAFWTFATLLKGRFKSRHTNK